MKKTWKREVAVLNLLALWYFGGHLGQIELAEVLAFPVFIFALGAFGMDWHGKTNSSINLGSGSNGMFRSSRKTTVSGESSGSGGNSERAYREGKYSDLDLRDK